MKTHKHIFSTALFAGLSLGMAGVLASSCSDDNANTGGSGGGGGNPTSGCQVAGQDCPLFCDPSLGCVECRTDGDCPATDPICVAGSCEKCGDNADCGAGEACFPANHECFTACVDTADCPGEAPNCDVTTGQCVGCRSAADCPATEPICNTATQQCGECASNADCGVAEPICEVDRGRCENCLLDAHCAADELCVDRECVQQVNCGSTEILCDGGCFDPATSEEHCGGCPGEQCNGAEQCVSGQCVCSGGLDNCGGTCTDTNTDPNHCGGCGNGCNDAEYCDGTCVCKPGLVEVNGNCIDPQSNPNNCGGQGPCDAGTPLCANGNCVQDCGNLEQCGESCVSTSTPTHFTAATAATPVALMKSAQVETAVIGEPGLAARRAPATAAAVISKIVAAIQAIRASSSALTVTVPETQDKHYYSMSCRRTR